MADDIKTNEAGSSQVIEGQQAAVDLAKTKQFAEGVQGGEAENSKVTEGQSDTGNAAEAERSTEAVEDGFVPDIAYVGQAIEGKGIVHAVKRVLGEVFIKIGDDTADWQKSE